MIKLVKVDRAVRVVKAVKADKVRLHRAAKALRDKAASQATIALGPIVVGARVKAVSVLVVARVAKVAREASVLAVAVAAADAVERAFRWKANGVWFGCLGRIRSPNRAE